MSVDQVAEQIIAQNTCGFTGCILPPDWQLATIRIYTTDNGEVELAGFKDDPLNRVCYEHKEDRATHMMIANKCWLIVLRDIETENPGLLKKIGKKFRMKRFELGWTKIG